jgi:phosphoribosylaminoimidazole-succinocarboxamide synthase
MEGIPLWHERDISHSSTERVALPDASIATDYLLHLTTRLVTGLVVDADRMRANLESSGGLIYTSAVLLELVEAGLSREDAYAFVQRAAMRTWETGTPFRETLTGRGKVRDLYAVDDEHLLLVASDRLSAYDVVLPTAVPDKGAVLTGLSVWWFEQLADLVPGHLVTARVSEMPAVLQPYEESLRGRSMLCRRLEMVQVECVARGYLTGSGLSDYRRTGGICGEPLVPGLEDGSRLPEPVFTPATKAAVGDHDENVSYDAVVAAVGAELAAELRRITLAVYARGAELAVGRGILLADTKLELGHDRDAVLTLGDEVLTPDSSRFWPAEGWAPGRPQPSYDKQYVRDWLDASGWDRTAPGPELPDEVVERTRGKYVEAYERLTGNRFDDWLRSS